MLKKIFSAIMIAVLLIIVAVPVATYFRQKPTAAVTIRSWSMAPLLTRGDLVLIWPARQKISLSEGQIVLFRSEEHGIREWTLHRIAGGDAESGFITRGDASEFTDQEGSGYPPIRSEWIAGIVPTLGSSPLKIPLLGHFSLYLEQHNTYQTLIPILVGVLAAALVLDEIFISKKRRRKETLNQGHLYFLGGLAVTVLMASLMLAGSLFITFPYGVEDSPGVLMGSDVGILEQGNTREITLAEIENNGLIPSYYVAVSSDPQVVLQESEFRLYQDSAASVTANVYAREPGLYQANVTVGMFLPFLPTRVIGYLSKINFWLALVTVSFIPALPVFIIPYLEPRYRRRFVKVWRQRLEHFATKVHLIRQ